jgi:hypothetical protein
MIKLTWTRAKTGKVENKKNLRRDLKHYARTACAALRGGAVEVALVVKNQAGGRIGSVVACEPVQPAVLPRAVRTGQSKTLALTRLTITARFRTQVEGES